jgi:excisionase family DNA binding protein
LTTVELAGLLRISQRCAERWAAAGKIPGRVQMPGRVVRWQRQAVLDWLAAGCPVPQKARRRLAGPTAGRRGVGGRGGQM